MARTGAIFGGEHSAHYYFRDFWNADTGMLAALHVLAALGGQEGPLSRPGRAVRPLRRAPARSTAPSTTRPAAPPRSRPPTRTATASTIDELDGLTVTAADWWFNLRASNTEPLLRLNVEARDAGHDCRRSATRSWRSSGREHGTRDSAASHGQCSAGRALPVRHSPVAAGRVT